MSDLTERLAKKKLRIKKLTPRERVAKLNIKERMIKMDMSQAELSYLTGIPACHLSRVINGKKNNVTVVVALKIARELKCPVEALWILQKPKAKTL